MTEIQWKAKGIKPPEVVKVSVSTATVAVSISVKKLDNP
jgi:hypothetical protein